MKDLLEFKEARIEALLNEVKRLQLQNEQLSTYIYELTDSSCPVEYKKVVKTEIFNLNNLNNERQVN